MKTRTINNKLYIYLALTVILGTLTTARGAVVEKPAQISPHRFTNSVLMSRASETSVFQTADGVVSDLQIPFSQTALIASDGSSEYVVFSGSIHLVVKYFPTDPVLPPSPIRIHTNLTGITGIGQQSGLTYRLTGASNLAFPINSETGFSFSSSYRLLPPSPIRELSMALRYNVSLNSDGTVSQTSVQIDSSGPGDTF